MIEKEDIGKWGDRGWKRSSKREHTIVSLPNESNAVKQFLRLLRGHRTPIHKAEAVFALHLVRKTSRNPGQKYHTILAVHFPTPASLAITSS